MRKSGEASGGHRANFNCELNLPGHRRMSARWVLYRRITAGFLPDLSHGWPRADPTIDFSLLWRRFNHLGNTWKPLVLMTRHFDYCPSASEGDNQSVRSSAPVVSRRFPGGYNVKLYISRGRLAWWLLAFLHSVHVGYMSWGVCSVYRAKHTNIPVSQCDMAVFMYICDICDVIRVSSAPIIKYTVTENMVSK